MASAAELIAKLQRDLNCLTDENKMTRKRAVAKVKVETCDKQAEYPPEIHAELFAAISKPVLKMFEDATEKCREGAVQIVSCYLPLLSSPQDFLPLIVPALSSRLATQEIVETSEELRLMLSELLLALMKAAPKSLGIYLDELVGILKQLIVDPAPEVKRAGCQGVVLLAESTKDRFHMNCKVLVKPLVSILSHTHAKIRVHAVDALAAIIMYGESTLITDVIVSFAQRTMDGNPGVRRAVVLAVGDWMCRFKDRYSYWHKMLPILLSAMSDDVTENAVLASECLEKAGRLYESENEEQLKDKLVFGESDASATLFSQPPCLGSRVLVRESFSKILPGALNDLADWTVTNRRQAARLLRHMMMYAGSHMTMHAEKLLGGLVRCVMDDEQDIAALIEACAETMGRTTEVGAWWGIMHPWLASHEAVDTSRAAQLRITCALMRGAPAEKLSAIFVPLVAALLNPDICCSASHKVQGPLLAVVEMLIEKGKEGVTSVSVELLTILLNMATIAHSFSVQIMEAIDHLAAAQHLTSDALYLTHTRPLLASLQKTCTQWVKASHEQKLFEVLLSSCGPALGKNLDLVLNIFFVNFVVEKDLELRLSFFTLFARLLSNAPQSLNSEGSFPPFAVRVIKEMILPNLIWKPGRAAGALRTVVLSCLWALLNGHLLPAEYLPHVCDQLVPQVLSVLDDDVEETRLIACHVLDHVLVIYREGLTANYAGYDLLHKMYPELLKRLDDNNDQIRIATTKALVSFASCMNTPGYDKDLYGAHVETLYKNLIVHLDDSSSDIQTAVFGVLKAMSGVNQQMLLTSLTAARSVHRTPVLCDDLIKAINA